MGHLPRANTPWYAEAKRGWFGAKSSPISLKTVREVSREQLSEVNQPLCPPGLPLRIDNELRDHVHNARLFPSLDLPHDGESHSVHAPVDGLIVTGHTC